MFFSGKCKSCAPFCPVTFGLALGLTGAVISFVMVVYMMFYGVPAGMEGMVDPSMSGALVKAGWMLVKGFVFGFVFACMYNLVCHWKRKCCGSSCDASCTCGNGKSGNGRK